MKSPLRLFGLLFACTIFVAVVFVDCTGCSGDTNGDTNGDTSGDIVTIPHSVKLIKTNGTEVDTTATPLPLSTTIQITFEEPILEEEVKTAIVEALVLSGSGTTAVDGAWAWNEASTQLTFTPSRRLKYQTKYTLTATATTVTTTSVAKNIEAGSYPFTTMTQGDINGDGFAELLIGAYDYNGAGNSRGAAYIFNGAASGLSTTYTSRIVGKVDNDALGLSWDTADVNGDGYADAIIPASDANGAAGAVYIHLGSASGVSPTAATTLDGVAASDSFGRSVANAGDVNGDGFDDIIVGAIDADDGATTDVGTATVFHGSATGISTTPDLTIKGASAGTRLGNFVSSAGDVNGDGFDDVCISAETATLIGSSYVHLGSATGVTASPATTLTGENASDVFGMTCRGAGDLNGDGYDDIVIGATEYDATGTNNEGAAYVYYGSGTGIPTAWSKKITGTQTSEHLGFSAGAGDINGDGYDDLMLGAYGYDAENGRSFLYLGSASGIGDTADKTIPSSILQRFGLPLPGKDYSGDGLSDVTIGAPEYTGSTGAAYTYYGSATGLGDTPTMTTGENVGNLFSSYIIWP